MTLAQRQQFSQPDREPAGSAQLDTALRPQREEFLDRHATAGGPAIYGAQIGDTAPVAFQFWQDRQHRRTLRLRQTTPELAAIGGKPQCEIAARCLLLAVALDHIPAV